MRKLLSQTTRVALCLQQPPLSELPLGIPYHERISDASQAHGIRDPCMQLFHDWAEEPLEPVGSLPGRSSRVPGFFWSALADLMLLHTSSASVTIPRSDVPLWLCYCDQGLTSHCGLAYSSAEARRRPKCA
jgi:hypothetical protein